MPLAGFEDTIDSAHVVWVLELARDSKRAGEIELAHPEQVDAVDCGDFVRILSTLNRLYERGKEQFLVCALHFRRYVAALIIVVCKAESRTSNTLWWVLGEADNRPSLLLCLNHRNK